MVSMCRKNREIVLIFRNGRAAIAAKTKKPSVTHWQTMLCESACFSVRKCLFCPLKQALSEGKTYGFRSQSL